MIVLEVRQADVTRLDVDAITNAANTQLKHGGGVALAISRAGGPAVQRESSEKAPIGLGDALGKAGANIAGLCALTTGGGQAEVHILVQDATSAFEALQDAGIKIVAEQEVIVLDMDDRPGALGEVAHKLGTARVNLTTAYLATNTRLVLAADNLAEAKAALG